MKSYNLPARILSILCVITICLSCKQEKSENLNSSTVYFGGDIITMESDTPKYAQALVERDGKIEFIGDSKEAMTIAGQGHKMVNLEGKTLLPAFLDGHGHFFNVGFASMCADLLPPPDGPGADFSSIVDNLNTYKESEEGLYLTEKLGWIMGMGYDDSQLTERDHPKASDLDKVSTEVPIIIVHQSGHLGVVNTKGLELMQFNASTKDPDGGIIRRDANGEPNGVLEESALFAVVFPLLGQLDDELSAKAIKNGQDEYAKKGYLTAQDGRT
ncbi:MAG: amidohydrolase family protein, partial [Bacteroidota bacterium]